VQQSPRPRNSFRFWTNALVLTAAVYVTGFIAFAVTLPSAADGATPAKADAIVTLTGGGARLDTAVALLEDGVGERLLISGVHPSTTKDALRSLVRAGARFDCCADLGFEAEDTRGNARETARWARERGYARLIVVTAAYHMPRSLLELAAEMPDVTVIPYPVDAPTLDLARWWRDPNAIRLLHAEYAKYLASLARLSVERTAALDEGARLGEPEEHASLP